MSTGILFAVDINEIMLYVLKAGAAVLAFIVGFFAAGPVANLLSRLAFQRPVPPTLLFFIRLGVGLALAVLVFFLVNVGSGGGGDGTGGGTGGGIGAAKDKKGGGSGKDDKSADASKGKDKGKDSGTEKDKKLVELAPNVLRVEITTERKAGAFFLFDRAEPALTLKELEARIADHLKKHKLEAGRLDLYITRDSYAFWDDDREFRQNIEAMAARHNLLMNLHRLDKK